MIGLHNARFYVGKVLDALSPLCARIEVAGSVRRGRAAVNDIDFVVLPKPEGLVAFRERASLLSTVVKSGDDIYIIRTKDGTQIDFYFARPARRDMFTSEPGNWGSVMLCRTGSKEHNIYLAQQAKNRGWKWETMRGLVDGSGTLIASETEQEIFTALGMDFITPERRER